MARPLMPKATAVWLVENTALTFEQIANFCFLHPLEVQAIADEEVATGMHGMDPIASGQLTLDEIDRCSTDPGTSLKPAPPSVPLSKLKSKGAHYTPLSKRRDRPDAIAWLLKNYSELSDGQVSKLIGTTKPTINAIRDKSHWNTTNIKPQNPVGLELCSGDDLEKAIAIARARAGTVHAAKTQKKAGKPSPAAKPASPVTAPESAAAVPVTEAVETSERKADPVGE